MNWYLCFYHPLDETLELEIKLTPREYEKLKELNGITINEDTVFGCWPLEVYLEIGE